MPPLDQDGLYSHSAAEFGPAIDRLTRCYERDPDKCRDLAQDIHLALWRSFQGFDRRCSLRTWTYRVAHNAAASYVIRERRSRASLLTGLEELEKRAAEAADGLSGGVALDRLYELIHQLQPLDRQVILSFLEGLSGAEISEITGLSASNVAVKIHRIKGILAKRFQEGVRHA
jgi:RNA polymerase sigma-70 factor (ECF subfamily)